MSAEESMEEAGEAVDLAGEVVTFLEDHYGTTTAARALWQWAGGAEDDVHALPTSEGRWKALWDLAVGGGAGASALSLLREVLQDHRSDPLILDFLYEESELRYDELSQSADLLVFALERLRPFGFPTAALRASLTPFEASSPEQAMAVLAPALDEWGGASGRQLLEERIERLESIGPVFEALVSLRDELRDGVEGDGVSAEQVEDAVATLGRLTAQVADWRLDEGDPLGAQLHRGLQRLERRIGFRKKVEGKMILAGLIPLLRSLYAGNENPYRGLEHTIAGLRLALWGTVPSFDPDPFAPEVPEQKRLVADGVPAEGPSEGQKVSSGVADLGELGVNEPGERS